MSLTRQQVDALLKPINPSRVLRDNKGMSHVSQQDVRAHLTRIFGFGGWSSEVLDLTLVREAPGVGRDGKDKGFAVTYRCTVCLTIRDPDGHEIASYEDVATGTSPNLPTLGDAHDFACKVAVSMALKRAATNLGDGFGLSLYNKGQLSPLVIGTLVLPDGDGEDASDRVPQQESMGHDDAGSAERPTTAPDLPARQPSGDPVVNGTKDPWATPVADLPIVTDAVWVKDFRLRVVACSQMSALRGLYAEGTAQLKAGQVEDADAADLDALLKEQAADIEAAAKADGVAS